MAPRLPGTWRLEQSEPGGGECMTTTVAVPNLIHTPVKPFYFNTSAHLLRITRQKANTLSEFLDALRECPEGSLFQHSFRTLQETHFILEGISHDFAH